jgi:acetoin utilization deacetylase AcuC-like enzyme
MSTQVVYSQEFNKHDNSGHPENAQRLTVMLNEIKKLSFYDKLEFIEPKILPEEALYKVHSDEMIQQIKNISSTQDSWIDLDTYVCRSDYETARLAAGGVIQICKNVLDKKVDNAYGLVRPPGHHATKDRSMGFCLFNNAAIAANELAKKGKKILIFDCDIHHGNGTQDIFYDRKDVLYESFHLSPHYPGTGGINEIGTGEGAGYTINAPLSLGDGDDTVSEILDEIFLPVAKQFKPDLIIFSAGYDGHHLDPLGGLKLTSNFFGEMILRFKKIQPKIVCTLEGGYNLNWMGKCFASQLGQMTSDIVTFNDNAGNCNNTAKIVIKEIKKEIGTYWKI